ncbi:pantetheine-phosphate adenylyltransferase [Candidatus Bathyarchaeota archaeon]|nr:pantetheine-phosphate adenylyltransferase [Candidatus Bathyarchaeota archaeon]
MGRKFRTVAVGGTFDEFHKGHGILLKRAFEIGEEVLVGLCSDKFVEKMKKPHPTASYEKRLEELQSFMQERSFLERARIVQLHDAYGVTLSRGCVEAIVVSEETEAAAIEINEKRKELGLPPLHVEVLNMVASEDRVPISTTRIYKGEIDREGHLIKR